MRFICFVFIFMKNKNDEDYCIVHLQATATKQLIAQCKQINKVVNETTDYNFIVILFTTDESEFDGSDFLFVDFLYVRFNLNKLPYASYVCVYMSSFIHTMK